jgi:hypothetical protein
VPRARLGLPEGVGIGALLVGPGGGFGQLLAAQDLLDPGARLAADIVLRYLAGDAVADRAPGRGGRSGEGGQGEKGGKAFHAKKSR